MNLFKKQPTPSELGKSWLAKVRCEKRRVARDARKLDLEIKKYGNIVKSYARNNDMDSCKTIAKQIVKSKRALSKLYSASARLTSLETTLHAQLAVLKMSNSISMSTEVSTAMRAILNERELLKVSHELSKEMSKAGIIEEMVGDAMEHDLEDMDEDVEEEVNTLISEVSQGIIHKAVNVPKGIKVDVEASQDHPPIEIEELENIKERLALLRDS